MKSASVLTVSHTRDIYLYSTQYIHIYVHNTVSDLWDAFQNISVWKFGILELGTTCIDFLL